MAYTSRTRFGYSLIEMSVALTIAAIISAAALSTYSGLVGSIYAQRAQSRLDTQLQRVARALAADLQEVGGGAVRPWHALFLQPTKGHADRLLVLTAESNTAPCAVERFHGDGRVELHHDCVACSTPTSGGIENLYAGRFAVLSVPGTGEGRVVVLGDRDDHDCRYRTRTFIGDDRDDGDRDHDHDDDDDDDDRYAGASLTVVDAKWLYLNEETHELHAWLLYDKNFAPLAAHEPDHSFAPRGSTGDLAVDDRLLATNVYDFEVAFGYDVDFDNVVAESVDGTADEWMGNAAGEMPDVDWIGDDSSEFTSPLVLAEGHRVQQVRMRAATVGLVMGLSARGVPRAPHSILDGKSFAETDLVFRETSSRATFRNTGVVQ